MELFGVYLDQNIEVHDKTCFYEVYIQIEHLVNNIWSSIFLTREVFIEGETLENVINSVYKKHRKDKNYRLTIGSGAYLNSKPNSEVIEELNKKITEFYSIKKRLESTEFNFKKQEDSGYLCSNTGIKFDNFINEDNGEPQLYGIFNDHGYITESNIQSKLVEDYLKSNLIARLSETILKCKNLLSNPAYPSIGLWEKGIEEDEVYYFAVSITDFLFRHWKLFDVKDELSIEQQLNEHPSNKYKFMSVPYHDFRAEKIQWRDHHQEILTCEHFLYIENGETKKAGLPLHCVFGEYGEASRVDGIGFRNRIWNPSRTPFTFYWSDLMKENIKLKNRNIEADRLITTVAETMNERDVSDRQYFKLLNAIWGSEDEVLKLLDLKNETLESLKGKRTVLSNDLWDIT